MQNDMLNAAKISSGTLRSDALALADELSRAANKIKWPRAPGMKDLERMAELAAIAGYYCLGDLMAASDSERAPLYEVLSGERPSRPRNLRKILDSRAPPPEPQTKKQASFQEVDLYATAKAHRASEGIGEISRPRQDAVDLFSASMQEGGMADPPYTPFLTPKLSEAPWAPQEPPRKRAAEAERSRERQCGDYSFSQHWTARPSLPLIHRSGRSGRPTDLAYLTESAASRNMEIASRSHKSLPGRTMPVNGITWG